MTVGLRTLLLTLALVGLGACEDAPQCPESPPLPAVSYPFWNVFFEAGNTQIMQKSLGQIDDFGAKVKELQSAALIETYADPTGDAEKDFMLSRRRGLAVRDALVRRGVPGEKIVLQPRGAYSPVVLVPKRIRTPEPFNDRAELRVPDGAWRPSPPKGYVKTTLRCVATQQLLVREKAP
jgi:hypothetical protein